MRQFEPTTPKALLQSFLEGRTFQTVRAYRSDIEAFRVWLGSETPDMAVLELIGMNGRRAEHLVFLWLDAMKEAGIGPAARLRRLSTLRNLLRFAWTSGYLTHEIPIGRRSSEVPLSQCLELTHSVRNRALLHLRAIGLRPCAISRLRVRDFDGRRLFTRIRGRQGWIDLAAPAVAALELWAEQSGERETGASLFSLTEHRIRAILHEIRVVKLEEERQYIEVER